MELLPGWVLWLMVASLLTLGLIASLYVISYRRSMRKEAPKVSILLLIQNQEDKIEGVIRHMMGVLRRVFGARGCQIVIVNASTDQSGAILSRMQQDYPNLEIMDAGDGINPLLLGLSRCEGKVINIYQMEEGITEEEAHNGLRYFLWGAYK
jgi:hypothetical protein